MVIGAGPAGLMAAEELAKSGARVLVAEAKPSVGRKLLMAGKSGLNLTKDEAFNQFMRGYDEAADWLRPMLAEFGPELVQDWAQTLGQPVFTGSSGRVFPKAMKASPLLRAWLARLAERGVEFRTRWRWTGWQGDSLCFDTAESAKQLSPKVTVLALGGASWSRLGSDGAWADWIGAPVTPFAPANAGLVVNWSPHMTRHFGSPIKGTRLTAGNTQSRGEFVISAQGLEGGGIYTISKALRESAPLHLDLLADKSLQDIQSRLNRARGKASLTNHLRKSLRLPPAKIALLQECAHPLPSDAKLAELIKSLPIRHNGLAPLDQAISTAGGLTRSAVDETLQLTSRPGTFAAGEMLDWEAPTGGYLLTACLATGRWAGKHAAKRL